jgi:type IV secretory pathway TrbD component
MRTIEEIPQEFCAEIRESANRPHMICGCEPELLAIAAIAGVLPFFALVNTHPFRGIGLGGALFFLCLQVSRSIGKYDPVWMRLWRDGKNWAQGYWPALHTPPRMPNVSFKRRSRLRR